MLVLEGRGLQGLPSHELRRVLSESYQSRAFDEILYPVRPGMEQRLMLGSEDAELYGTLPVPEGMPAWLALARRELHGGRGKTSIIVVVHDTHYVASTLPNSFAQVMISGAASSGKAMCVKTRRGSPSVPAVEYGVAFSPLHMNEPARSEGEENDMQFDLRDESLSYALKYRWKVAGFSKYGSAKRVGVIDQESGTMERKWEEDIDESSPLEPPVTEEASGAPLSGVTPLDSTDPDLDDILTASSGGSPGWRTALILTGLAALVAASLAAGRGS